MICSGFIVVYVLPGGGSVFACLLVSQANYQPNYLFLHWHLQRARSEEGRCSKIAPSNIMCQHPCEINIIICLVKKECLWRVRTRTRSHANAKTLVIGLSLVRLSSTKTRFGVSPLSYRVSHGLIQNRYRGISRESGEVTRKVRRNFNGKGGKQKSTTAKHQACTCKLFFSLLLCVDK